MADWTTAWKPAYGYDFGPEYDTLVTDLEGGAEQRRQKRTSARHVFSLSYDTAREEATIQAIKEFQKARGGRYEAFNFPNYGEMIKGARLACANTNPDRITDSSSGFVTQGFAATHDVVIDGSGAGNDGVKGVQTVAAGILTLDNAESLAAESANADLTVYKAYSVRFASDLFRMRLVSYGLWTCSFNLIEVL